MITFLNKIRFIKIRHTTSVAMNASPSRLPSGKIGCPRCETALSKDQAPFYLHGEYVGNFESYVCSMCHYSALTEDGYESARIQARLLSLIEKGPDVPEIQESKLAFNNLAVGKNDFVNSSEGSGPGDHPMWITSGPLPIPTQQLTKKKIP